ncbi:hypothetical protein JYT20_00140 [Rhodothermus sp. AH-315-K08]|nr:hypothetical protein [Rhodothermus sp. AH-315-K08]
MEKTKTAAPPKKKRGTKGTPPTMPSANLERKAVVTAEAKKKMTFDVRPAFRKEYKLYALSRDPEMTMTDVFMESFRLYKEHNP